MYEELKEKLLKYVKAHVKESRYRHTLGVVKTALELAEFYGVDKDKAEIAAIFHDACRDAGNLQHGPAAAELIEKEFDVKDKDIINAIKYHTTGRRGMSELEKLIYISDGVEPGRDYPGVERYREHMYDGLDLATYYLMKHTKEYVESLDAYFAEDSNQALLYLEKRIGEKMDSKELALLSASILDKKKARDITLVDISERSGFADYFVIATAGSKRQMESLISDVEDELAKSGMLVRHIEGKGDSGWILMDYGDLIINIFTEEQRDKYQIEKIWNDCPSEIFEGEN